MNKGTHPSRWAIKHESSEKFCQVLLLPLGKDTRPFKSSTKFFNRVYREWDGRSQTYNAGDFATALRELRDADINLRDLPQISANMADTAYLWLDEFDIKVDQFRILNKEAVKAGLMPKKEEPKRSRTTESSIMAHVVMVEYIKMAGPMGDPKQIAEKTKAVLDAYEELNNA